MNAVLLAPLTVTAAVTVTAAGGWLRARAVLRRHRAEWLRIVPADEPAPEPATAERVAA